LIVCRSRMSTLFPYTTLFRSESGYFIDEIFARFGESVFRDYETKMLSELQEDSLVVACGGGIVEQKRNKALMNGLKIYLDTPLRSEEHTSELQSRENLVCRLL